MTTMRQRFYERATHALHDDPRAAIVLAEIGASELPARHERLFNVGIREQLMIGVAAGLAFEGLRPIAHSYAPFLVERPYEQIKLDLGHQDVGAILVSTGASYDGATSGRTHQAPADVALLSALPGWTIHVPGHPDELERMLAAALRADDRVYIRMSEEANREPVHGDGLQVLRRGSAAARGRRRGRSDAGRDAGGDARPRRDGGLFGDRAAVRRRRRARAGDAAPTWCSSSPTSRARRRARSPRRSPIARTGCWRWAWRTPSCAATAPAASTAPRTAWTPSASAARCRSSSA